MKVLITGGTGFVGAHTAAALQRNGHELRLLVRDTAKADRVSRAVGLVDVELVSGNVTDEASVGRALAGCDAVLHAAATVALDRRRADEAMVANAEGAKCVLRGAADQGLRAIVHVSSTSALAPATTVPLVSSSAVATSGGYAASKAAAELVARELQEHGAPLRITYPSGVIGPAAGESLGETSTSMARFVAAGVLPTLKASLSLLDVRDLASIHSRLIQPGDAPGRVLCGGTHLAMAELGELLHQVTGRRFRALPIPPALLRGLGRVADLITLVLPVESPITEESMSVITRWQGTADDAPEALGIAYRPMAETMSAAVRAWFGADLLTARQAGAAALADNP